MIEEKQSLHQNKVLAEGLDINYQTLIEEMPIATCLFVGRDMRITVANDVMLGYWGKDRSVIGQPLAEALPELKGQPFLQILDKVFTTGKTYEAKATPVDLVVDGVLSTYCFDITYKPLHNETGEVYAIMETAVDVTGTIYPVDVNMGDLMLGNEPPLFAVARDITKRKKTEQALKESEERFQAAVIAVQGVLWTNNAVGEMDGEQPGWSALTGQSYHEYQGYGWANAVHPDDAQPTIDAWHAALVKSQMFVFEHRVRMHTGLWGLFSIRAIPLLDSSGAVREWVGVHTDITEQRRAKQALEESESRYRTLSADLDQQVQLRTQQLQESVYDLSRSNQNLQQFAYVASHDLQEPLRKIQSFGDLLQQQYADQLGAGVDHLQRMQTAAGRMSTLIKDLLAFSRISTRQETTSSVSLTNVIREMMSDLEVAIAEAGAQVDLEPLPTVPGDESQLGQLFQNLLGNALKFRRSDTPLAIRISTSRIAAADVPPLVKPARTAAVYHRIDVSDNGIGFDEKYADRIFQVFQRLHSKNEFAGTGIGLAICEKVAANHGGAITATSQPGQGATFSVYLPG